MSTVFQRQFLDYCKNNTTDAQTPLLGLLSQFSQEQLSIDIRTDNGNYVLLDMAPSLNRTPNIITRPISEIRDIILQIDDNTQNLFIHDKSLNYRFHSLCTPCQFPIIPILGSGTYFAGIDNITVNHAIFNHIAMQPFF